MPRVLDQENINGLQAHLLHELSAIEQEGLRRHEAERALLVFGAQRLAQAEGNAPSPEAISRLTWQIEEYCTGPQSTTWRGISECSVQEGPEAPSLCLTWNPAGIIGGFDGAGAWDRAAVRVDNTVSEQRWLRVNTRLPRLYNITEGLYIDHASAQPMIVRSMWTDMPSSEPYLSASKPATAVEVAEVAARIARAHEAQAQTTDRPLPLHVEVGYGLDPQALLTRRSYRNKRYVGIDSAVGQYDNPVDSAYPKAVQTQSERFLAQAATQKPGEHIHFVRADGRRLPLPNRSVRELFMSNILNADIDDQTRQALLSDAHRVLEQDGNLVARVNWHRDEWQLLKMVDTLRQSGFWVIRSVRSTDPEYAWMESVYGTPSLVTAPEGYYLIAEAKEATLD